MGIFRCLLNELVTGWWFPARCQEAQESGYGAEGSSGQTPNSHHLPPDSAKNARVQCAGTTFLTSSPAAIPLSGLSQAQCPP